MKLAVFCVLLLACTASCKKDKDEPTIITAELFPEELVVYSSPNNLDIVNLIVPINALNFDFASDDPDTIFTSPDITLFFVEGTVKENGEVEDKGLYILTNKTTHKLLENGRDATASLDESTEVFFGAADGIYSYNAESCLAEKYGSVTDDIVAIAKTDRNVIYYVNKNKELYKVTDEGTKAVKIDEAKNVLDITIDSENSLYFYGEDKIPYVLNENGIKGFNGLPENPKSVKLVTPPFFIQDGTVFISDNKGYVLYYNGTVEPSEFVFEVMPTAFGMAGTIKQYYAYNKKIYEYDFLALLAKAVEALDTLLNEYKDDIQDLSTRSRPLPRP